MCNEEKINDLLRQVRTLLQQETHEHCVSVNVFFNCEGYEISQRFRSPGSLNRDGISMRNIAGNFIK